MKYYCQTCKTVFDFGPSIVINRAECPLCKWGRDIIKIPDYETPAHYEARTKERYPDKGLVWTCSHTQYDPADPYGWQVKQYFEIAKDDYCILIASPPVPPPNDFVPEEEKL